MYSFLIAVIILLAIGLCVIILLQAGKGGGLASTFGGASSSTDSFMGGRQAASLLTRLTWAGGGLFLFLALILSVLSSRSPEGPDSILQDQFSPTQQAPQPSSVLEREAEGEGQQESPPAPPEQDEP